MYHLPSTIEICTRRCKNKAQRVIKEPNHLVNSLLQKGSRYTESSTERLRKSIYPQATWILNKDTVQHYFFIIAIVIL